MKTIIQGALILTLKPRVATTTREATLPRLLHDTNRSWVSFVWQGLSFSWQMLSSFWGNDIKRLKGVKGDSRVEMLQTTVESNPFLETQVLHPRIRQVKKIVSLFDSSKRLMSCMIMIHEECFCLHVCWAKELWVELVLFLNHLLGPSFDVCRRITLTWLRWQLNVKMPARDYTCMSVSVKFRSQASFSRCLDIL